MYYSTVPCITSSAIVHRPTEGAPYPGVPTAARTRYRPAAAANLSAYTLAPTYN